MSYTKSSLKPTAAPHAIRARAGLICVLALIVTTQTRAQTSDSTDSVYREPEIAPIDRQHWSFLPLDRPDVPRLSETRWIRNPIDAFILQRLQTAGLRPSPDAPRRVLIRRLSFDLRGLPPTVAETQAFLQDERPDAYERLVDRFLADDAYGEHWGQHWLDLARFAETDGFEHDKVRSQAWRYRDWVIAAMNADTPYDEFIQLQIAGDELRPRDPAAWVATGFLLCGPDMPDINLAEERRHNVLNDMTSTVSSVVLGLQMGCAQCHDHKFDPISIADFYRLRANFESAVSFADQPLPSAEFERRRQEFEQHRAARWEQLEHELTAIRQAAVEAGKLPGQASQLTPEQLKQTLDPSAFERYERLTAELKALKNDRGPQPPLGRVLYEASAKVKPAFVRVRGDFRRPGMPVSAAVPRVINYGNFRIQPPSGDTSTTTLRSQLATWITQPSNPLATRVIVNRVWQFHFGHGLSRSESDFGLMGEAPTHPELLDWLACELSRRNWSLKQLHRLILNSATYRQSSYLPDDAGTAAQRNWARSVQADPERELLSRFPRRRLQGEAIRDTMLAVSGRLTQRRGGPGVRPPLPAEIVSTLLKNQWPVTPDAREHARRSVYLFVRRNLRYPIFHAFDKPDTNASCARRNVSTTAPQALFLYHSLESQHAARAFASRLRDCGSDRERIELAFELALSRPPTADELSAGVELLRSVPQPDEVPPTDSLDSLELFCLTMFNLNEFLYVD